MTVLNYFSTSSTFPLCATSHLLDITFTFWVTRLCLHLFFIMSLVPYWKQSQEQNYFNWKCYICCIIAQSPMHLENQFIVEHDPYKDVNGEIWVKCSKCNNPHHLKFLNLTILPPRVFSLFFSFMQCKVEWVGTNISCMFWFLLCMFQFLLCMFLFLNILFCLFRMGNKKPRKKKPKGGRLADGRSHWNECLNRWHEEAMMYAIQEYNSLCVQHGADNVSIKAVAEGYPIPTTTFWKRYIPELSPPLPNLLLSVACSECSGMILYSPFSFRLNSNPGVLFSYRICGGVVGGVRHCSGGHGRHHVYSKGIFQFYTFPCLEFPSSTKSIKHNLLYIFLQNKKKN